MKTYKIYTLGCKVNQYDAGKLAAELKLAGLSLASKNAGLAVISSCAVTKTAMVKSGRMIKLAREENPQAKIALAGCWPNVSQTKLAGVDFIIGGEKIIEQINRIMNHPLRPRSEASELRIMNKTRNYLINNERARYFIKIQDGCEQFCSYCIIPYTRGKLKSRPIEEVVAEIKQAVKAGFREIVLSGIHLGLYGQENKLSLREAVLSVIPAVACPVPRHGEPESSFGALDMFLDCGSGPAMINYNVPCNDNLVDLLKKIIKIKDLGRVRLSSIEITEVTDELINLIVGSKKICRQLHLPLQAGSDKILKLMNRPYDSEYFKNKIKKIRRVMPEIAITTDVITGFPGETEEDFFKTEEFIKQIKFSRLHVFPFSAHEKTPAAKMPNQVEEKIKARRANLLRKLNIKLMEDYKKKFKGRVLEIVVERLKPDKITGKTEYYFEVEVEKKDKNIRAGQMVKARI